MTKDLETRIILGIHRRTLKRQNNLKYIRRMAKVYFKVADKDFNSWYLHFLKLYWNLRVSEVK